jgi:hypothetical protein
MNVAKIYNFWGKIENHEGIYIKSLEIILKTKSASLLEALFL